MHVHNSAAAQAAACTLLSPSPAEAIFKAACVVSAALERGQRIDADLLRLAMREAFDGDDSQGAWDWKQAYDACEVASVLFLRKFGAAMWRRARGDISFADMLGALVAQMPTHTRRSLESQSMQQFSTPLPLGAAVARAACLRAGDVVLEPSAGCGLLAIHAELAGARLHLNELAEMRAELLALLFPTAEHSCFDAAQIDDHLDASLAPSVVLMNPPFSALAHVEGRIKDTAFRHLRSAFQRLAPGGRLVAITGANLDPSARPWREGFHRLQEHGRVLFSAPIAGALYAKHGAHVDTRLTVIDKEPAADASALPASMDLAPDVATLIQWIEVHVPPRLDAGPSIAQISRSPRQSVRTIAAPPLAPTLEGQELVYTPIEAHAEGAALGDGIYEPYRVQRIAIEGACPHPTQLVQSAAMASVQAPLPTYRPHLPPAIVGAGILSEAQLESVIYAGQAHQSMLAGHWRVDETFDVVTPVASDEKDGVQFRRGWFLGDGTGAGKGRQVAGILLDNWLKGRTRAIWISKSDKLLEDAQRDWSALGMERLLVTPLARFAQGSEIKLASGILFATYATLRSEQRGAKASRVQQIVDWLGRDFDGVIIFDESHALANAAGAKGERGDTEASLQGRAGLRLQHALPNARIVYVSATGATSVHNLAYAQRLGLWGGEDFPFASRAEFVAAIEAGGVAAMEVVARDLKALGLYMSRSLSYEGVQYEMVEHQLTAPQIAIYDSYAEAFQIIHNNLDAALEAAGVSGPGAAQARSAAKSAFESAKQRFFNHLITGMKAPTLLAAIERDLEAGHSAVVQIVSTGEALLSRRLAEIPTEEWNDLQLDITPREYVLDYLAHSFPVALHEPYTDGEGNLCCRPVMRDGKPVENREAVARREALIARLASLPAVPGALDQLVQHFGAECVAEITGRSRRIIRLGRRFALESRSGDANLIETQAFMDDAKRILVFSEAGGTGRSYHAELSAKNQRLRVHYLLEPGWKADSAIQGLGRTNRTNQKQPPLFRPVSTNVKAEKRFLSTIARRLDTLGAITRGQRQTGGQGLFRAEDNLEGQYGRDALRQLFKRIAAGAIEGCTLQRFEEATGLSLTDETGLRDQLPAITTFLNRMLALPVALQDILFGAFEDLLSARIEGAIASGIYDVGLETLRAESFRIEDRRVIHTHGPSGAETSLLSVRKRQRNAPIDIQTALNMGRRAEAKLMVNTRSGRAGVALPGRSVMLEDGAVEKRMRIVRPLDALHLASDALAQSQWEEASEPGFIEAWNAELVSIPEFAESMLFMVTGLLLPIWKRLPSESARIYRLQTDEGERIVGRIVQAAWANAVAGGAPTLSPLEAMALLEDGASVLQLSEGLELRRVRIMGAWRIELLNFTEAMRDRLTSYGLFHEIISWKLRMFVPMGGGDVLDRLLNRFPLERICQKGV